MTSHDIHLKGRHPNSPFKLCTCHTWQMGEIAASRLGYYVKSKANDVKVDFWKDSYIKDSVEKRILEYCNASLVKWIDYIFFKEDIIHDSISDEDKQFIESKMVNLTQMLDKIADDYIIISFSPQTKQYNGRTF